MKKIVELLIIIGFGNTKPDSRYLYIDNTFMTHNESTNTINTYIIHIYTNGIEINKNGYFIREIKSSRKLEIPFVIDYLNKEFLDIIRKHKIKNLLN